MHGGEEVVRLGVERLELGHHVLAVHDEGALLIGAAHEVVLPHLLKVRVKVRVRVTVRGRVSGQGSGYEVVLAHRDRPELLGRREAGEQQRVAAEAALRHALELLHLPALPRQAQHA